MTSDYYEVHIKVDDLEWTITDTETADLEDVRVLDNLTVDWAMPDGLWPQQPEPLRAAFALYVPDFQTSGVADLKQGSDCQITVRLFEDLSTTPGPPFVEFYGRVSDLKATRADRRPGVMLSIAAIDYTVDLANVYGFSLFGSGIEWTIETYLEDLWLERALGTFPAWPFAAVDVAEDQIWRVDEVIRHQLRQAVTLGVDPHRLIIAPLIDDTTSLPDATQPWAFDPIYKDAQETSVEVESCYVETDSVEWLFGKGAATAIEVTSDGELFPPVTDSNGVLPPVIEQVSVTIEQATDAEDVATFYLPPADVSGWRLQTLRFHVGRLDEADLEALPPFFPQWTLTEGDDARSSCYGRAVHLSGIPADRTPHTGDEVHGRLTGAALTVSGGRVVMDLQLRQTVPPEA